MLFVIEAPSNKLSTYSEKGVFPMIFSQSSVTTFVLMCLYFMSIFMFTNPTDHLLDVGICYSWHINIILLISLMQHIT